MPLYINVHCKKQPVASDLAKQLNWEPVRLFKGRYTYRWIPKACDSRIFVTLDKEPIIQSDGYDGEDKESIDHYIALARSAGVEVPEELIVKFKRDNRPSRDEYTIRADRELYDFASRFPHLEDVHPWFKFPFGLVKFTQGVPTYEINLEATFTASERTLKHLTGLAGYFATAFDGIVYDSENDEFGIPDAGKLSKQGMELFALGTQDWRALGWKVRPKDF